MKYRRLDENSWHDGETRNISRSGLLFQAEDLLPPSVVLEINLVLPAEIAGLSPTEVVCRGEVVRTVSAEEKQMPAPLWQQETLSVSLPGADRNCRGRRYAEVG